MCVIRVKATSIFYDGSVEGVDPIETFFDVYVVDSEDSLGTPTVKFDVFKSKDATDG